MKTDELHIITQILAGKTGEFAYFLDTYGTQVFSLIVRMVGSEEDAEELTQDTFMKAFEHLSSFNGNSSFSTWIYRIAYNTALSALRKKQTEVLTFDDKLWNILELLPPDERALLTLFYEEEKTIAEIAHILNQSEGNIKVKLHRLRKKLYVLMKTKD